MPHPITRRILGEYKRGGGGLFSAMRAQPRADSEKSNRTSERAAVLR
jgi:hypothetical protein